MVERKFCKPMLTSQYKICPIPFRLDCYVGCNFGCKYCFARDCITFRRKRTAHPTFSYIYGNDPVKLKRWIEKVEAKDYNYARGEEVAFKERIPVKIGGMSDPFPYIEENEKITYEILKILDTYDYPVQISTKNPGILAKYFKDFHNPNWTISVSMSSYEENYRCRIEPNAPDIRSRLTAIRELTDQNAKVLVRIQPVIYPMIMNDLPELIRTIKDFGCWGFIMEGLKVRVMAVEEEQRQFKVISDYLGYDIRDWYKKNGIHTGSDYELRPEDKKRYISLAKKIAQEYGIKCFIGDNNMCSESCNGECCGTEILRNYKILSNLRSRNFNSLSYFSEELPKCKVNFVRDPKNDNLTISQVLTSF